MILNSKKHEGQVPEMELALLFQISLLLYTSFCSTRPERAEAPRSFWIFSTYLNHLLNLGYEFIESRNSSLLRVCCMFLWMVLIASIEFMSDRYLRRIHMRSSVVLSCRRSSRRVDE